MSPWTQDEIKARMKRAEALRAPTRRKVTYVAPGYRNSRYSYIKRPNPTLELLKMIALCLAIGMILALSI